MNRHEFIRCGGSVKRYHTRFTIGEQTVAAHSWGVAAILLDICEPSVDLLRAALLHDVAEHVIGDTPANAKWASPDLKDALKDAEHAVEQEYKLAVPLNEEDALMLSIADMLELMWYCLEQRRIGNTTLDDVWSNGLMALSDRIPRHPQGTAASRMLYMICELRDDLFQAEPSSI